MEAALAGITSIRDLPIENKRLFLRVDFNVPMEDGRVTDDTRIREALPTIKHAIERGARVILASHLGRPKKGPDPKYSLVPAGERLAELLGVEVHVPDDCVGDAAKKVVYDLRDGQVCLLENLRFHPEEEKDDPAFAEELKALCDVYVDDAFGSVHRAHASVHALPKMMRERGCGFLLEKEIAALGKLVLGPDKPYVAVLGGAKVSDKIAVVEALMARVDALLVGGAMANTFLAALGKDMKKSLVEGDKLALARTLVETARDKKVELLLPVDGIVAKSPDSEAGEQCDVGALPADTMMLDIGPKTVAQFAKRIAGAKTVFWNGPMGLFEKAPFSAGTFGVARALANSTAFTVVGGGDSAAAVNAAGGDIAKSIKHISTGGGASLELIEGKKLPGIEVLRGTP
ncbi:MAG TPA: phosphoglycerate kinase [Polyangiaceae bacterium]|jgi:phosphoglycerate kinase